MGLDLPQTSIYLDVQRKLDGMNSRRRYDPVSNARRQDEYKLERERKVWRVQAYAAVKRISSKHKDVKPKYYGSSHTWFEREP